MIMKLLNIPDEVQILRSFLQVDMHGKLKYELHQFLGNVSAPFKFKLPILFINNQKVMGEEIISN